MSFYRKITRLSSSMLLLVFGLSMMTFAPVASAAPGITTTTPPTEYRVYDAGSYKVDVNISNMEEDTTVKMYVKGPMGGSNETEKLIETYTYINPQAHTFSWDGKFDTNYVMAGTYQVRFEGSDLNGNTLSPVTHSLTVTDPAKITITNNPGTYSGNPANYTVSLDFKAVGTACVVWRINEQQVSAYSWTTGAQTATWNGLFGSSVAAPGTYNWRFYIDSAACSGTTNIKATGNLATGTVTIATAQPAPVVSNLSTNPNPYDPEDGSITLGYNLSQSLGSATVEASIAQSSSPTTILKSWTFTSQANGNNTFPWDGQVGGNDAPNGSYIFKVWGKEGTKDIVPQQATFTVAKETPPPSNKCAGFPDVSATHSDCEAIEYVKSIGAMTGNSDGTFAPNSSLQRDQIAKIVLETFDKYTSGTNYCGGNNPFPDVTSSAWAYQYICRGQDLGMITGYLSGADAGYYRPSRAVNRVEFLALLLRNVSDQMPNNSSTSYSDVPTGQWYSGYAKYSKDNALFTGSNLYPTQPTTRVEVARIIFRLHELGEI